MTIGSRVHQRITRLNHLALMAQPGGHQKARDFYVGVLEMEEIPLPQEIRGEFDLLWFRFLDMMIHLSFSDDYIPVPVGRHICLEVKGVLKLRARLEHAGYAIEDQIKLNDRDRFFIPDPFGNYFELMEFHDA
jgi:catechol 2,3-dioxygenase-like lactoylglutathione lyase family enzyme